MSTKLNIEKAATDGTDFARQKSDDFGLAMTPLDLSDARSGPVTAPQTMRKRNQRSHRNHDQ